MMSDLTPKTGIMWQAGQVRFVPKSDMEITIDDSSDIDEVEIDGTNNRMGAVCRAQFSYG